MYVLSKKSFIHKQREIILKKTRKNVQVMINTRYKKIPFWPHHFFPQ